LTGYGAGESRIILKKIHDITGIFRKTVALLDGFK